jgi:hypothetical protein
MYVARHDENTVIEALPLHTINTVIDMTDDVEGTLKQLPNVSGSSLMHRHRSQLAERKAGSERMIHEGEDTSVGEDASFFSRKASISSILQIKTGLDSVNAGRSYYLSTRNDHHPEELRQVIVTSLWSAVLVAKKKALAMTRFQNSQEHVRSIQGSMIFQITMAVLIMLVTMPPFGRQSCFGADAPNTRRISR